MKALIVLLVWVQVFAALGQTGPGGVGSKDGASNLVFWLDANQISTLVSGSRVSSVTDLSGKGNNVTPNQDKPQYVKNVVNGNAVIRFDGVNSDLRGDLGNFDAPGTIIAFARYDQTDQGEDDNDYVFSIGSANAAGTNTSIARRKDEDGMGLNKNLHYTWDGGNLHYASTTAAANTWLAFAHVLNTTNTLTKYHQTFVDGSELSYSTDFPSALNSDGKFEIGDFRNASDNTFKLDGDVAEVAIFDRLLNTAELNIIYSYLAGKYDHSTAIGAGTTYADFYAGDDNGKGDYDLDIVGIGRHSSSETNDRAYSAGMTMNISVFDDGDYMLVGHALEDNGINTSDIADTDVTETLEARWERIWYFDLTDAGNDATVNLTFNLPEAGLGGDPGGNSSNYKILYRSGQSGSWDLLSTVPYYDPKVGSIIFTNVDVGSKGDGYFTLGTVDNTNSIVGIQDIEIGATGPGGIVDASSSSDLELWLDATEITSSDGESVVRWLDKSGKTNDATQSSSLSFPTYDDDGNPLNGNGILHFDGNDDYLAGNLDANLSADATVIALGRFGDLDQAGGVSDNDYFVSIGDDVDDNSHISISRRRDEGGNKNKYYSFDASTGGGTASLGPVITGQQWTLISGLHRVSVASSQRHTVYFEGTKEVTDPSPDYSADFAATTTAFEIGRWVGAGNYLSGQLAEVMVFSKALNIAELNIVHSYLSAKWNHSLTGGDKYAGDDLGNGGVCDGIVTCQPDYDLDVAGIGTASDGSNTSATSAGLQISVSAGQSATFTDGDYMLLGHNTTSNNDINTDLTTQMGDPIVEVRSKRDWYLDVTETDASKMTVDLTFDFTEMGLTSFPLGDATNYRLMYRATNELDDEWTVVASASSISGDQLTFSNISTLDTDGFITVGSISHSESPLPVKLLEFDARAETDSVRLFWSTADETNNAFFAVQRSADGFDFEDLLFQTGYGDSQVVRHYEVVDNAPLNGINYYRLRQVDFNGYEEFSEVRRVTIERKESDALTIYPNPASHYLKVKGAGRKESGTLLIRNGQGMTVLSRPLTANKTVEMDISGLKDGMYLLEARWPEKVETHKILIKR